MPFDCKFKRDFENLKHINQIQDGLVCLPLKKSLFHCEIEFKTMKTTAFLPHHLYIKRVLRYRKIILISFYL